jgi:hypothetical protein
MVISFFIFVFPIEGVIKRRNKKRRRLNLGVFHFSAKCAIVYFYKFNTNFDWDLSNSSCKIEFRFGRFDDRKRTNKRIHLEFYLKLFHISYFSIAREFFIHSSS